MSADNLTLDDVIELMMQEVPRPTATTARDWGDRYPVYRDQIADFVAEWLFQEGMTEKAALIDESALLNSATEHLNRVLQGELDERFPGVLAAAERIGLDTASLGERMGANEYFIEMIDRRAVSLESVPGAFLSALSEELRCSVRSIARWMTGGAGEPSFGVAVGQDEADSKSFAQAWREAGLSQEALRRWSCK
ncbi:MAG TPA: hypothetical protein VNM24_07010 [Burkholderiales bacterium]|nr:hypothetical protein [Burkholderiales bacterium]